MSEKKIAINGFGRVGRPAVKEAIQRDGLDIILINDLTEPQELVDLFKLDSVHGRYQGTVEADSKSERINGIESKGHIIIDEKPIMVFSEKDPANLIPVYKELGIKYVLESTGLFIERQMAARHLYYDQGKPQNKVLVSNPGKGLDYMLVMGVNEDQLKPEHSVISNASCTTNALAPVAKVMNDEFGINYGLMTTIHSYTNDQRILDVPHRDPYRRRAAAISMIPTKTGAAKAIGIVIPELEGKLNGMAVRVPTPNGSVVDLVAQLEKSVTVEEVNNAFYNASEQGRLKGYLGVTDEPWVSVDVIGDKRSSVVAVDLTMVKGNLAKVFLWYDNEIAYAVRCIDAIQKVL